MKKIIHKKTLIIITCFFIFLTVLIITSLKEWETIYTSNEIILQVNKKSFATDGDLVQFWAKMFCNKKTKNKYQEDLNNYNTCILSRNKNKDYQNCLNNEKSKPVIKKVSTTEYKDHLFTDDFDPTRDYLKEENENKKKLLYCNKKFNYNCQKPEDICSTSNFKSFIVANIKNKSLFYFDSNTENIDIKELNKKIKPIDPDSSIAIALYNKAYNYYIFQKIKLFSIFFLSIVSIFILFRKRDNIIYFLNKSAFKK